MPASLPSRLAGSLFRLSLGVSCVAFRSVRFFGGSFRSLLPCALVGFRSGRVVPPVWPCLFWRRGGRAVFFPGCRRPVRGFLGFPAWPGLPVLCRASRPRLAGALLAGVCSRLPASRARSPWRCLSLAGRPLRCRLFPVRWRLVVPSLPLLPAPAPAGVVGFSGGRRLSPAFRPLVAGVVAAVLAGGRSVVVGCAGGADAFVRSVAPGAVVFAVPGSGLRPAAWFAARSVALVRSVAAGGPGSGFVAFPSAPCPVGLSPSAAAAACFCGLGSGSWASAAFAAGLGLPVVVFPCGFSALPPWGVWVPAGARVWASGFRLVAV